MAGTERYHLEKGNALHSTSQLKLLSSKDHVDMCVDYFVYITTAVGDFDGALICVQFSFGCSSECDIMLYAFVLPWKPGMFQAGGHIRGISSNGPSTC
jgi:hypothetical protein